MDINLLLCHLVCLVVASVISQTDVCVNFKTLNSTILKTDYTALSRGVTIPLGWYRYTGTTSGVIATSCPTQSSACGAKNPIWIEGALPTFGSGIQQTPSCVRTDRNGSTNCCGLRNKLDIANCNGFFVYHLTPTAPGSNYCFNASAPDLSTVTMPQTTTIGTSQDTTWTKTTLPLTTQTRNKTTTVQSTIAFQQTTSVNNTAPDATPPDLSTVTMPKTTIIGTSKDTTSTKTTLPLTTQTRNNTTPVPSTIKFQLTTLANDTSPNEITPLTTLTSQKFTTLKTTHQSQTRHSTATQNTQSTRTHSISDASSFLSWSKDATSLMKISTPQNNAGSSESKEESAEPPQLLIGIVTGSVFGCVVVIIAVIAAVFYIKKFRGDRNVTYREGTAVGHRTSDLRIKDIRFKRERPYNN